MAFIIFLKGHVTLKRLRTPNVENVDLNPLQVRGLAYIKGILRDLGLDMIVLLNCMQYPFSAPSR